MPMPRARHITALEAKLLHFCDDILDGSKDDPIALSTYENCRHSVSKGGVSLSYFVSTAR